jgi:hypothetical protein
VIFDCFPFFNEFDVLEMRLTLLADYVDRFVLCEAPFTYNGNPKPLWYAENAARFAPWHDKIVHLVYPGAPDANPWANEWGQRAFLTNGLQGGAPGDIVLYGDLDEIPDPRNIACLAEPGKILGHRQRYAVGFFNRVIDRRGWIGTRSVRLGDRNAGRYPARRERRTRRRRRRLAFFIARRNGRLQEQAAFVRAQRAQRALLHRSPAHRMRVLAAAPGRMGPARRRRARTLS